MGITATVLFQMTMGVGRHDPQISSPTNLKLPPMCFNLGFADRVDPSIAERARIERGQARALSGLTCCLCCIPSVSEAPRPFLLFYFYTIWILVVKVHATFDNFRSGLIGLDGTW